jgi:hypothetical protein
LLQLDSVLKVCLVGVRMMVVVNGDAVEVERAVEFVAHLVHSVLVVASTFDFEGWDLYIP